MRTAIAILILSLGFCAQTLGAVFPFFASRGGQSNAPAGPDPLFLNTYGGAVAAYSVRKLDTNYAGSCIRVRRTSDDTEQDIGFSGNDIDETSLESFCSATDGYVVKWYDQSGNANHAINSTNGRQPQIVSSGAMLTKSSKAAIWFAPNFALEKLLPLTTPISGSPSWSVVTVFDRDSYAHNLCPLVTLNAYVSPFLGTSVGDDMYVDSDAAYSLFDVNDIRAVMISIATSGDQDLHVNNSEITETVSNSGHAAGADFDAIGSNGASFSTTGSYHEIIIYSSDKTASVSGISGNVNTYYSIY